MKKATILAGIGLMSGLSLLWWNTRNVAKPSRDFYSEQASYAQHRKGKVPKVKQRPNDWFYMQRAYPFKQIPVDAPRLAAEKAREMRRESAAKNLPISSPVWTEAGPSNIPGRIADLAVHPTQPNVIYAGSAAGGVFKSVDFGGTWTAIFDNTGTQSIGAIAIHPANPNILYVGTGEPNAANDMYEGTGVYKSTDGGQTWNFTGLPNSLHIGRIVIDPLHPETVFVAVCGRLFGTSPDRGVYRSPDGGTTWNRVLYVSDSTACVDLAVHPASGTVFASMWEVYRNPRVRMVGGLTSGIYRSTNHGDTWTQLGPGTPGLGLPAPSPTTGRIGVSVDPLSTTVYAIYIDHPGNFMGLYKSTNLGDTWARTNDAALTDFAGGFGWYFGQVRVAPGNPNTVYALGVSLFKSINGGASWDYADPGIHVDHHAMYILPSNQDRVYDGCDGGVNYTANGGLSWTTYTGMANTQFYANSIDPSNPLRLYGGTQDNGTLRTLTGVTGGWEWFHGGDGFYSVVDYTNSNIIYAEYQWGWLEKSVDGGYLFDYAMNGINYDAERHNWCTPFVMDPSNHNTLYYGSNLLYKTMDGGANWSPVSGDLTNGDDPGNLTFGTITTIDVAPTNGQVIYVGTDDANVWVTTNGGTNWQSIKASLPNRWVTRVTADPHNAAIAYVTLSGYKEASHLSHIFRTVDYGQNWTAIHGDLFDTPINDVIVDPDLAGALYIGTDFGVFTSANLGVNWVPLGIGMPIVPVHDLAFHPASRTLVAGTHGRSMFKTGLPITCNCPYQGDLNNDGVINVSDVLKVIQIAFVNGADVQDPLCPKTRGDVNNSGAVNVDDVLYLIKTAFINGPDPVDPCL